MTALWQTMALVMLVRQKLCAHKGICRGYMVKLCNIFNLEDHGRVFAGGPECCCGSPLQETTCDLILRKMVERTRNPKAWITQWLLRSATQKRDWWEDVMAGKIKINAPLCNY